MLGIVCVMSPEPSKDLSKAGEKQLCLGCMAPNEPSAHFCVKCGAPLTSYAATGPFESRFAQGHAFRQAAEQPRKLIVVLGVWLFFGMLAFGGIFLLVADARDGDIGLRIIAGFIGAISVAMIWKTTRNYFFRGKAEKKHDA